MSSPMTNEERFKEIKRRGHFISTPQDWMWLLNRYERLTEALEWIRVECSDSFVEKKARQALEAE